MTEAQAQSLELVLDLSAFAEVHDEIEKKLEDYYEWRVRHPNYIFDGDSTYTTPTKPRGGGKTIKKKKDSGKTKAHNGDQWALNYINAYIKGLK